MSSFGRRLGRGRSARARGEEGFLLVEVMISALLVGLIAVATFNGFDVASRFTADQRRHSEAELLAAESQEQLRSDPATALDALETEPHSYTRTVNGTEYTITQEAKAVNASGTATGCTFSESSSEHGANILITSSVTWALLKKGNRPAVKQASVITPPIGSALEVDVKNGASPPAGVPGVTAIVKFVPEGSGATNTAQGTTASAGCVVLSGLATTEATVEIARKPFFVTEAGLLQWPTKEVSIVPNLTTQYPVTYAEEGRIEAEFTYKGETEVEGKKVTGDTFVAEHSMPAGYPTYVVGSAHAFTYETGNSEEPYLATTSTYNNLAWTAAGAKYLKGDLFPYPSNWAVFSGDCPKNDTGAEALGTGVQVHAGETVKAVIPLSYTRLNVLTGNWAGKATATADNATYLVTLTDTECEGYETPLHAYASTLKHTQSTSGSHLPNPFQPFGKQTLCLYNEATKRTYTSTYTNSNATGTTLNLYDGQASKAERETEESAAKAKRESEEAIALAAKAKRETEEKEAATAKKQRETEEKTAATAKTKRETEEKEAPTAKAKREKEETEMAAAKKTREEKEKAEREKWAKEVAEKKLKASEQAKKESEQKAAREEKEKAESTEKKRREKEETEATAAKKQREKEETEAAAAKTQREKEEAEAGPRKTQREKEETEAAAPKKQREKEETEAAVTKVKREEEEKEFEEKTGFKVASGQKSC